VRAKSVLEDVVYRKKINELIEWKSSKDRKPLILEGARQVGKTWLLQEFAKTQYKKYAYISLENNPRMKAVFDVDLNPKRLIQQISLQADVDVDPEDTLIILDEIQEIPRALTSLKYFCEDAPEYHIAVAGSLLGIALHEHTSFPVGKVDFLQLYPLNFGEFLIATGNDRFDKVISDPNEDRTITNAFSDKLTELLKVYYVTGGLPKSIMSYLNGGNLLKVRAEQSAILKAYANDFSKHAPKDLVPRIGEIWNSAPFQLAKENKKFVYKKVKPNARAAQYESALLWLHDTHLATKVERVNNYAIPLGAYADPAIFKLFVIDVGLLGAMVGLDPQVILDGSDIFKEFKGGMAEQFVFQEFVAAGVTPYYFSRDDSKGELDFIIEIGATVSPVEVKAEENLQSKSLKAFYEKHHPPVSIRTSLSGYRDEGWLVNIPLYMVSEIASIVDSKV
jgi:predicted AAA+ superfamily ATPase